MRYRRATFVWLAWIGSVFAYHSVGKEVYAGQKGAKDSSRKAGASQRSNAKTLRTAFDRAASHLMKASRPGSHKPIGATQARVPPQRHALQRRITSKNAPPNHQLRWQKIIAGVQQKGIRDLVDDLLVHGGLNTHRTFDYIVNYWSKGRSAPVPEPLFVPVRDR